MNTLSNPLRYITRKAQNDLMSDSELQRAVCVFLHSVFEYLVLTIYICMLCIDVVYGCLLAAKFTNQTLLHL